MPDIKNYYLDLKEVLKLSGFSSDTIISLYEKILHNDYTESGNTSVFYSLYNSGFLKEIRVDKVNEVLDE